MPGACTASRTDFVWCLCVGVNVRWPWLARSHGSPAHHGYPRPLRHSRVRMHACMFLCHSRVRMHVCMFVCMYACMYVGSEPERHSVSHSGVRTLSCSNASAHVGVLLRVGELPRAREYLHKLACVFCCTILRAFFACVRFLLHPSVLPGSFWCALVGVKERDSNTV